MARVKQPSVYIPHGGGTCFFMPDPGDIWTGMATFLRQLAATLPEQPTAIILISAHWETDGFAFTCAAHPALHVAAGRALAPLRDEGVLIIGSGMSFHNMRGYGDPRSTAPSQAFDQWLTQAIEQSGDERAATLNGWATAPSGRFAHPAAEHLLPLMVAAGTSEAAGKSIYSELVMETAISAFRFD